MGSALTLAGAHVQQGIQQQMEPRIDKRDTGSEVGGVYDRSD